MHKKITTLQHHRKRLNIPLHDVAHLLRIDVSQLAKIEKGILEPKIEIILLYHLLFGASFTEMLSELTDELTDAIKRRSSSLINQLYIDQPPKSSHRIRFIENFVNQYNTETKHDG